MNKDSNSEVLQKLGLNDKEIVIYLHLTNSGVQSIKQISDATSVNRTTVYRYLESLIKKDLIEWIIGERGRKVQVTPPNNIKLYLSEKKQRLENLEKTIPSLISQLQMIKPIEKFATQVRYYKGEEGIKQIIWNTLQTKGPLYSYTPLGRRDVINPDFEDRFEHEWARRKLIDKVITNETHLDYFRKNLVDSYKKTLEVRILPSDKFYITSDTSIYNNTVSIMSFEKEALAGVEIDNKEMASNQKSIFNIVWEVAKPFKQL
ncbi:MAG: helix-turn-helix domain-containing protein [Patescibacteria group bacterium]|nr:helix-turn-helix domain-containing protein [Patescibacteria group bacterium]